MKNRILGLDIVRAVAIIFVLIAHTTKYFFPEDFNYQISMFFGFIGVELFFVLSGFLIGGIIINIHNHKEETSLSQIKNFWIRRWFRTLPNYFLILIIFFFYYWISESKLFLLDISVLAPRIPGQNYR